MQLTLKKVLIIVAMGTLVSAQQVSSENVFEEKGDLAFDRLLLPSPDFSDGGALHYSALPSDTVEAFDIEIEEEGPGLYKEIAVFLIVAAVVGYMVVKIINPGDEEEKEENGGKEPPPFNSVIGVSVPLNRSP